MSIGKKAVVGATWLAVFKLIRQFFSWATTIFVARMLSPGDYGLLELSIIFTGYASIFSELGLGAAIIQRKSISDDDLNSVFWFSLVVGILLSITCFPISYITAFIFKEPRVIPLTQAVSIVFILSSLLIVPSNLLKKNLEFKRLGYIEVTGTLVSCGCMLVVAVLGGGVWTLVTGIITQTITKVIMTYYIADWFPRLHYNFQEAKSYLKFGIAVAISRSFFYIGDKGDRFFAGRAWATQAVGYYSFALELAQLPTEKITTLINQVSFPVLAKLQGEKEKFNEMYLKIVKITMTLVLPIFVGGYLISEEAVIILLGDKWAPIIFIFKFLCLTQIFVSLNAINSFTHNAQGRPKWSLYYFASNAVLMTISFYFASQHGIKAMLIPWFSTYLLLCIVWISITYKKIGITTFCYLKNIFNVVIATILMAILVSGMHFLFYNYLAQLNTMLTLLIVKILFGSAIYVSYLWHFDRELFDDIKALRGK